MLKLRLVHPGADKEMGATYYFVMATIFNGICIRDVKEWVAIKLSTIKHRKTKNLLRLISGSLMNNPANAILWVSVFVSRRETQPVYLYKV